MGNSDARDSPTILTQPADLLLVNQYQWATEQESAISKRARRRDMRSYEPVAGVLWRERHYGEELPPQTERGGIGSRAGNQRCGAIGLMRGDCDHSAWRGRVYCYYHEKLRLGLIDPSADIYPVWPLPAKGYVIINDRRAVA